MDVTIIDNGAGAHIYSVVARQLAEGIIFVWISSAEKYPEIYNYPTDDGAYTIEYSSLTGATFVKVHLGEGPWTISWLHLNDLKRNFVAVFIKESLFQNATDLYQMQNNTMRDIPESDLRKTLFS